MQIRALKKKDLTVDLSPLKEANIEFDLSQRDFTINAMAINLTHLFQNKKPTLIDPFNGINDIKNRLIRMSSSDAFTDDPLRLIRAFRLSALHGLQIEEKTKRKISAESARLKFCSWERIRNELFSILEINNASHHIQALSASGLLEQIVFVKPDEEEQKVTKFTVLTAIENVFDDTSSFFGSLECKLTLYFRKTSGGISKLAILKFSALMYDNLTLPTCKESPDLTGENLTLFKSIVKKMKLSNKAQLLLNNGWQNLSRTSYLLTAPKINVLDCYTLFRESGRDGIFNLLMAFGKLKSEGKINTTSVLRLQMVIGYFFDQYLKLVKSPLLRGTDIISSFNISQGKKVGELLQIIERARAANLINNKETAIAYIKDKLG